MQKLLIMALLVTPALAPLHAQSVTNDRVLTVFGADPCPDNTICVRAPESERYRIPKQFRNDGTVKPDNQSWAERSKSVLSAGATSGTGSCTASGPGGWTGCFNQQMQAARAERKAAVKPDTSGN